MPEKKAISAFYEPGRFDDDDILQFMNQEIPDLYRALDKKTVRKHSEAIADINETSAKKGKRAFDDESRIREDILSFKEQFPDASSEEFDNFVMETVAGTGNVSAYSKMKSDRALHDSRRASEKRSGIGAATSLAKFDLDAANGMLESYGLPPIDMSSAQDVNVPSVGRVRPKKAGGFDVIVPAVREPKEKDFRAPVILENPASGQAVTVDSDEEYADLLAKGFRPYHAKTASGGAEELIREIAGGAPGAKPAPTKTPTPTHIIRRK
jgi:hypothetical protein